MTAVTEPSRLPGWSSRPAWLLRTVRRSALLDKAASSCCAAAQPTVSASVSLAETTTSGVSPRVVRACAWAKARRKVETSSRAVRRSRGLVANALACRPASPGTSLADSAGTSRPTPSRASVGATPYSRVIIAYRPE